MKDSESDKKKSSVKTPWGNLAKSKPLQDLFDSLNKEITQLNNRILVLEKEKPILASIPVATDSNKIIDLEKRVNGLETELQEIQQKLSQIKEKFSMLSQQLLKMAGSSS